MARVTGLGKLLGVAVLAEDALLLKDKHGVLQLFLTASTHKVLGVPVPAHGRRIWPSADNEREKKKV